MLRHPQTKWLGFDPPVNPSKSSSQVLWAQQRYSSHVFSPTFNEGIMRSSSEQDPVDDFVVASLFRYGGGCHHWWLAHGNWNHTLGKKKVPLNKSWKIQSQYVPAITFGWNISNIHEFDIFPTPWGNHLAAWLPVKHAPPRGVSATRRCFVLRNSAVAAIRPFDFRWPSPDGGQTSANNQQ